MSEREIQSQKEVEREADSAEGRPEKAAREADEGKEDLLAQQRQRAADIKAGGRSGVTGEFGRVTIDGAEGAPAGGAPPESSEIRSFQASEHGGANQPVRETHADGSTTTRDTDGTLVYTSGDGRAGAVITPEGRQDIRNPDGTEMHVDPSGRVVRRHADGSTTTTDDVSTTTVSADGRYTSIVYHNGEQFMTYPGGSTRIMPDGRVIERRGNEQTITYPQGGQETTRRRPIPGSE
jgi:hypothetical protein